jgi:hypothetical protein
VCRDTSQVADGDSDVAVDVPLPVGAGTPDGSWSPSNASDDASSWGLVCMVWAVTGTESVVVGGTEGPPSAAAAPVATVNGGRSVATSAMVSPTARVLGRRNRSKDVITGLL